MPTYPLAFPSAPNILTFAPRPIRSVGMTESPFNFSQQVFDHQGAKWVVDITIPPMKTATAYDWEIFILQCRGMSGTFLMGPPLATPTGTGTSGDLATAGTVYDDSITVQNTGSGATFKKGNWLQIGVSLNSRLHKIATDATADGSGNVVLNIEPPLKDTHIINSPITVSSPVGVWRLGANDIGWRINAAAHFGFNFSAVEVL